MADGQIVIDVNANTGKASKELVKLQNQLAKIESKASQNSAKKSAIEQQMETAQQAIERTKQQLVELKEYEKRLKDLEAGKKSFTSSQAREYVDLTGGQSERASQIKALSVQYESQLKNYESMKNKAQQLTTEEQALNKQLERQKGLIGQQEANDARQGAAGLRELKKEAGGTTINFKKLFMTIIKYGFGVRSFYILFNKLKQAIKQSFAELAKSDAETKKNLDSLKASLAQLKGSFGAAFAPIINAVIPWLVKLIDWLSTAMNAVQKFFTVLSGKGSYKKAIANMNAVSGAAGSLQRQLMGFDEINKLDNNSGGGSGAGYDYIDEAVNSESGLLYFAKKLRDSTVNWLKDIDTTPFIRGWNNLRQVIGTSTEDISDFLIELYETVLLPISKFFVSFAGRYFESVTEIFKSLAQVLPQLMQSLRESFGGINEMISGFGQILKSVFTLDDSLFIEGIGKIAKGAKQYVEGFWKGLKIAWDAIKEPVINLFNNLIDWFKEVFDIHSPSKVMEELAGYLIDGLFIGLEQIGEAFSTWWETSVKPWFTWEKWQSLGAEALRGIKDGFAGMASSIKLPSFSFKGFNFFQHARGGIVTRPTLFGTHLVGEAGREAIIPLENHTEWIDKVATQLYDAMSNNPLPAMASGYVVPPNSTGGMNDIMQALQGIQASFEAFRERGINVDVTSRTYLDGREMSGAVTKYQKIDSRALGV